MRNAIRRGTWRSTTVLSVCVAVLAGAVPATPVRHVHAPLVPDPATSVTEEAPPAPTQRDAYLHPRSTSDRPDTVDGPQVHVVYMVVDGFPDERLDEYGVLDDSLAATNTWMHEQSGARWRLDMAEVDIPGAGVQKILDVTFVETEPGWTQSYVLARAGLDDPDKRYLTFAAEDRGTTCGVGETPGLPVGDDVKRYATVYLYSHPACRTRHFAPAPSEPSWAEAVTAHELLHTDGAVPVTARNACVSSTGHVCRIPALIHQADPQYLDVMYPILNAPLSEKRLDIGRDDYFDHGLPYRDAARSPYLERT